VDKKRVTVIAVAGAIVLVAVVLGILYFTAVSRSTAEVLLPETAGGESVEQGDISGGAVAITADTVRDVVARMARPGNYHSKTQITLHTSAGDTVFAGETWAADGRSLVAMEQPDGGTKYTLTGSSTAFVWYSDAPDRVLELPAGDFSGDDAMLLYTYEDVVNAPDDAVRDAGYETACGESCVYVLLNEGAFETKLWVSVEKGILLQAERTLNGGVIYEMTTTFFEQDVAVPSTFTTPDGRVVS